MPALFKFIGLGDEQIKHHAGTYGNLGIILGIGLMIGVIAAYFYLGQRVELIGQIMEAHARTLSGLQPVRSETLAAAQAMKAISGVLSLAFHCAILFSGVAALLIMHEGMLYRKTEKLLKQADTESL